MSRVRYFSDTANLHSVREDSGFASFETFIDYAQSAVMTDVLRTKRHSPYHNEASVHRDLAMRLNRTRLSDLIGAPPAFSTSAVHLITQPRIPSSPTSDHEAPGPAKHHAAR